jgi:thioredoxin-related protein
MHSLFLIAALAIAPAIDLQALGCAAAAAEPPQPIVLYVSRTTCAYCRRLESAVLKPLQVSGTLTGKAHLRELVTDVSIPLAGFDGLLVTPAEIAASYDANVTPILLFLDGSGEELAPRITGYNGSDFFSVYLERAISQSISELQARPVPATGCD